MRTIIGLGALLLVLMAVGCDSDQPLQSGEQTLSFTVKAPTTARIYNVWDVTEITAGGSATGPLTLWCEGPVLCPADSTSPSCPPGSPIFSSAESVPWHFSIRINLIPAGETEAVILTSSAALTPGPNLSLYDPSVSGGNNFGAPPGLPSIVAINDGGTQRRFQFQNSRRMTEYNVALAFAAPNLLHTLRPALFDGVCPNSDLGQPRIDGDPQPFTIELNKGDSITVDIRKFDQPPGGVVVGGSPSISATVLVDGHLANVNGSTSAGGAPGSGFSFSYTAR